MNENKTKQNKTPQIPFFSLFTILVFVRLERDVGVVGDDPGQVGLVALYLHRLPPPLIGLVHPRGRAHLLLLAPHEEDHPRRGTDRA